MTSLLALALLALATSVTGSYGQPDEARRTDPSATGAAHAWLVLPSKDDGASALIHVPPRRSSDGGRFRASEPGTLRVARHLAATPVGVGAWGDEVFLLMPASAERAGRVLSLRAHPSPVGDYWSFEPRARLAPVGVLPVGSAGVSIIGTGDGPVVLLHDAESNRLVRHEGGSWVDLEAPIEPSGGVLVSDPDGDLVLMTVTADSRLSLRILKPSGWERPRDIGAAPPGFLDDVVVATRSGNRLVVARRRAGAIELLSIDGGESELVSRIDGVDERSASVFAGDRSPAFIAAWSDPKVRPGVVELVEVSTATGQELYRGRATNTLPVSATQFRILAAALVALMAIVLLVILRPGANRPITLPEGYSLAEPGRRLVATAIDLLVAAFIVSLIFRLPLLEVITLTSMIRPGADWIAAPSVLAIGFGLGVLGEAAIGRSLGKAATGCLVVRASGARPGGGPLRAGFARSILRNAVKWGLPPVAALALIDPTARHRGDTLSGLAVVIPPDPRDNDANPDP